MAKRKTRRKKRAKEKKRTPKVPAAPVMEIESAPEESYVPEPEIEVPGESAGAEAPKREEWEPTFSKPMAMAITVVLIVCIIGLAYLFFESMKSSVSHNEPASPPSPSVLGTQDSSPPEPVDVECFAEGGFNPNVPVFSYLPTCPHCKAMIPHIVNLEKNGYEFTWVDSSDPEERNKLYSCFSGLVSGYVPQLICPKTKKQVTGERSENEVRDFAEACKNA